MEIKGKFRVRKQIALQIILPILGIIILVGAVAVALVYREVRQRDLQNAQTLSESMLDEVTYALNTWISDQLTMARMIAAHPDVIAASLDPQDPEKRAQAAAYVNTFYDAYGYHENFPLAARFDDDESFTIVENGERINIVSGSFFVDTVDGQTLGKGSGKSYIAATFAGQDDFISVVYPSILRGNPIFVIAQPVRNNDEVVGAAIVAPQMDYFTNIFVQNQDIGETGYMIFFDDRGMLIAHPDTETILNEESMTNYDPITSRVIAGETVFFAETAEGENRLFVGRAVNLPEGELENNWYMAVSIATSEVYQSSQNFLIALGVAAGLIFLILIVGVYFIIRKILIRPMNQMITVADRLAMGDVNQTIEINREDELGTLADAFGRMIAYFREMAVVSEQMAAGDLRIDIEPLSDSDEFGNAFKRMIKSLRALIGQVKATTGEVSAASAQLSMIANQASRATGQIASTVQQVALGAQQQTEAATQTAVTMEQMGRSIEGVARGAQEQAQAVSSSSEITSRITAAIQQVSTNAQESAKSASSAATISREGAAIVRDNIEGMQQIKQKVDLSSIKVEEMGKRSEQIGAIIETIDDIASQTNLLALNAAIEAARAGEHGKGFAVVAEEVRKLAERTVTATKEITDLITIVQSTVLEAVTAMGDSAREVEAGTTKANDADSALHSILEAIEAVNGQVEEISRAAEEMATSSDELVSSMDSVSAVVEENTAATEEMAAGSNEFTKAIDSIASVSEENSAAVEEVSSAAEEMNAQVEEVTASAENLADMAAQLQDYVARFRIPESEPDAMENKVADDGEGSVSEGIRQAQSVLRGPVEHSAPGSNGDNRR